ncbi:MAG TPA: hypothetical protein PKE04_08820, partial [Clostridia bacterium]|nr:hypothetical protein [Clostridia bacterium]
MNLAQYLSALRQNEAFMRNVACWREIPARDAVYAPFPEQVDGALRRLAAQGCTLAVLPEMWDTGYAYRELN